MIKEMIKERMVFCTIMKKKYSKYKLKKTIQRLLSKQPAYRKLI